jgi:putative ABC transport system ATP-binding protein
MLCTLNREGATVIVVTHSPACAERAHRIVHLLDGRIVGNSEARI